MKKDSVISVNIYPDDTVTVNKFPSEELEEDDLKERLEKAIEEYGSIPTTRDDVEKLFHVSYNEFRVAVMDLIDSKRYKLVVYLEKNEEV